MSILQQQASDVRTQEINLSQVITSASSSVVGQIIVSNQGPTTPTLFTNAQDYLNTYGNPNAQISFDVYCALDYFKEGNQLWGLRVAGAGAMYAAILLYVDNGGVAHLLPIAAGVPDPTNPNWSALVPTGGTALALFYGNKGPGSYADSLAISIQSTNAATPTSVTVVSASTGGTLPAATYAYQVASIGAQGETLASNAVQVVIAGAGTTNANTIGWNLDPNAIGYKIYGRTTAGIGLITQVGAAVNSFVDTGGVTVDTTKLPITSPANLPPPSPVFNVNVYDMSANASVPVEPFDCSLADNIDGNGLETELEERINPYSQYIQVTSNVASLVGTLPTIGNVAQTTMTGGNSGAAPTSFAISAAWNSFNNKQLYGINLLLNSGHSDPTIQLAMDTLAQARGDSVGLLDVPSASQTFQAAIDYRNLSLNLNSTYSALFCPDVLEADAINGKQQYVPFSGWAAALCARTDRVANPAFSPAGLNRGLVSVLKTRYTYDDGQATSLFKAQVNYTRTFIGQGIALWEQQTLAAQQSALSWLSVRRITNVIKTSLYQFLIYSLQEPNDDFTGRQIVTSCSQYLQLVQNARGISSFGVASDASNNTAGMFNSGIRTVTVVIVPQIPIHEIDLQVVISKQGVSFTEVLSQVAGMSSTSSLAQGAAG